MPITDGSRYGTTADASVPPSQASMPASTSDNYRVTRSAAQPSVTQNLGAPLRPPVILTDELDTVVRSTNGEIFLWENTPNRYSNGLQIQADANVTAIWVSLSDTLLVQADQIVVNGGAALPSPSNALWTKVALDANGYAFVDGQVHGIYVQANATGGRVVFLSR